MSSTFFKINSNKDGIKFMDKITLQLNDKSMLELKTFNQNLTTNESANLLCYDYTNINGDSFNDVCKKVKDIEHIIKEHQNSIVNEHSIYDISEKINTLEFKMGEGNIKIFDDIDQISESLYEFMDSVGVFKNDIESHVLGNSSNILDNSNRIDNISKNMNVDSGNLHDTIVELKKDIYKKTNVINDNVVELKQYTMQYVDENMASLKNEIYYKVRTEIQDEITRDLKFNLVESLRMELNQELLDEFNLQNENKYNKLVVENCTLKNELNSTRESVIELYNVNKEIELKKSFGNVLNELKDSFSKKTIDRTIYSMNQEIESLKDSVKLLQKDNKILKELSDKMVLFEDECFD